MLFFPNLKLVRVFGLNIKDESLEAGVSAKGIPSGQLRHEWILCYKMSRK